MLIYVIVRHTITLNDIATFSHITHRITMTISGGGGLVIDNFVIHGNVLFVAMKALCLLNLSEYFIQPLRNMSPLYRDQSFEK